MFRIVAYCLLLSLFFATATELIYPLLGIAFMGGLFIYILYSALSQTTYKIDSEAIEDETDV